MCFNCHNLLTTSDRGLLFSFQQQALNIGNISAFVDLQEKFSEHAYLDETEGTHSATERRPKPVSEIVDSQAFYVELQSVLSQQQQGQFVSYSLSFITFDLKAAVGTAPGIFVVWKYNHLIVNLQYG